MVVGDAGLSSWPKPQQPKGKQQGLSSAQLQKPTTLGTVTWQVPVPSLLTPLLTQQLPPTPKGPSEVAAPAKQGLRSPSKSKADLHLLQLTSGYKENTEQAPLQGALLSTLCGLLIRPFVELKKNPCLRMIKSRHYNIFSSWSSKPKSPPLISACHDQSHYPIQSPPETLASI